MYALQPAHPVTSRLWDDGVSSGNCYRGYDSGIRPGKGHGDGLWYETQKFGGEEEAVGTHDVGAKEKPGRYD